MYNKIFQIKYNFKNIFIFFLNLFIDILKLCQIFYQISQLHITSLPDGCINSKSMILFYNFLGFVTLYICIVIQVLLNWRPTTYIVFILIYFISHQKYKVGKLLAPVWSRCKISGINFTEVKRTVYQCGSLPFQNPVHSKL